MTALALRLTSAGARLPTWSVAVLSFGLAVALGWAYMNRPALAFLPAAVLVAIPLLTSVRARIYFVVFGTLAVFQSSNELTAPKLAFLLGFGIAFGATILRLPLLLRSAAFPTLAPMVRASVVLFAVAAASLPVSIAYDVPQTAWLRDVAPYVLFAAAPLFALDALTGMKARELRAILVVAGTISALSFTARWVDAHAIADLPIERLGLPSLLLPAALFAYGVSALLHEPRLRLRWLLLTSIVLAGLVSTGTRGALVVLAAPLAIVIGSRQRITRRSVRFAVALPIAALIVYAGLQGVIRVTNADRDEFTRRVELLFASGDRSVDRSYIDRVAQTEASWRLFVSSPLVGVGPGHLIPWTDSFGDPVPPKPNVDSSVSYLTKFGLLGVAALVAIVVSFFATLRRLAARTGGTTTTQLALLGFGAIVVGWSVLVVPFEDKGLATATMLLLAAAAGEATSASNGHRG